MTLKLFRGQNASASRGENERAGGAKNEKSISEAARFLGRQEYVLNRGNLTLVIKSRNNINVQN